MGQRSQVVLLLLSLWIARAIPASALESARADSIREAARAARVDAANPPIQGRVDPDTYRVGPGDEFAFRYSDLLDPKIMRVGPAGEILLPDAGAVPIAGLTLREAETKVRAALKSYVRGRGLVFALYRPRSFRIPVLGEVEQPGVVTLTAPVRASEAIQAAGGISYGGARRGIVVRRGGDSLAVDLIRYEHAGDLSGNPLVFETDVVFVPASGPRVEIYGSLPHTGRYDVVRGDRLSDLVALAGGPLPEAAVDRAELERLGHGMTGERMTVRLAAALAAPGGPDDLPLEEGDRLFLPARAHYKEGAFVTVFGEVLHPGPYAIRDGVDGVRSVVERAGGLTSFADVSRARVERHSDLATSDTTFLNLARQNENLLTNEERGYVKLRARERDAISADLSGVLTGSVGTDRRDRKEAAPSDIVLRDRDWIVVPRLDAYVSVQGEVGSPGLVPHTPGRSPKEYVRLAGGFTDHADKGKMRVTRARTGQRLAPDEVGALNPGDTIWVPVKPDRNKWTVLRDVLTTAAQVATVYLVVREATK